MNSKKESGFPAGQTKQNNPDAKEQLIRTTPLPAWGPSIGLLNRRGRSTKDEYEQADLTLLSVSSF